jgi:hypothetical protein
MSVRAFLFLIWMTLGMSTAFGASADLQKQLLEAIRARDPAAVRVALDAGADPNSRGDFARTPLHLAARESAEATEILLSRGANPNVADGDGRTPLHLAYAKAAEFLLGSKADLLALDRQGNSALHTAAESDAWMCRLLVEAGLPVDARNNSGLTPLHFAALQGNRNTAEFLLARGADVNARTLAPYSFKWTYIAWDVLGMEEHVRTGSTPLAIVREKHRGSKWVTGRYRELDKFLIEKGASEDRKPAVLKWLGFGSPVAFVAFFWMIFHFDARLRGWDDLAARFESRGPTPASMFTSQDGFVGRVGMVQTKRMLRAAATPAGLYLAMPRWVVAAHPPLMIPWSQLRVESCRRGPTGQPWLDLKAGIPEAGRISLSGGIASSVLEKLSPGQNGECR